MLAEGVPPKRKLKVFIRPYSSSIRKYMYPQEEACWAIGVPLFTRILSR